MDSHHFLIAWLTVCLHNGSISQGSVKADQTILVKDHCEFEQSFLKGCAGAERTARIALDHASRHEITCIIVMRT